MSTGIKNTYVTVYKQKTWNYNLQKKKKGQF